MSIYHMWDSESPSAKLKSSLSPNWTRIGSTLAHPDNESKTPTAADEKIFTDLESENFNGDSNHINIDSNSDFGKNDDHIFQVEDKTLPNKIAQIGQEKIDYIQLSQEPWPEDAELFQPYEAEQILLPDNASCLAVQAFLKMCSLPFAVKMRWNAEWLCSGVAGEGRVPVLRCGAFVATELEGAAELVVRRGIVLAGHLQPEQRADMRAYMSLVSNVLLNAELYVSWLHKETYASVSRVRCGAVFPWPLSWMQVRARRHRALQRLRAYKWHEHTLEQVLSDVDKCCTTLSERLGDQEYFFGVHPTQLDAQVFGHVAAMLVAQPPTVLLRRGAASLPPALLRHVRRITSVYFSDDTPLQTALEVAFQGIRAPAERAAGDVLGPMSHIQCPQTSHRPDRKPRLKSPCRDPCAKQHRGTDNAEEPTKKIPTVCRHTEAAEEEWVAECKVADWISRCGDNFRSESPSGKRLCDIPERTEDNNSDAKTRRSVHTSGGVLYEGLERKSSVSRDVLLSVEELEQMEQIMNETGAMVEGSSACSPASEQKVDDKGSVDSKLDEAEVSLLESENENGSNDGLTSDSCGNENINPWKRTLIRDKVLIEEPNEVDEAKSDGDCATLINTSEENADLIKDFVSVSDANDNYDVPSEDWANRDELEIHYSSECDVEFTAEECGMEALCEESVEDETDQGKDDAYADSRRIDREKSISKPASKIPTMRKKLK